MEISLAGGMLVLLALGTTSIGVDQWFGAAADPSSTAVSASMVPVFAAMTVVGLVALGAFLRGAGGQSSLPRAAPDRR